MALTKGKNSMQKTEYIVTLYNITHGRTLLDGEIDFSNISIVQGLSLGEFVVRPQYIWQCSCSRAILREFVILVFKGLENGSCYTEKHCK